MDLLNEEIVVKIADLGYARNLLEDQVARTGCGTPLQMAPETLLGRGYSFKIDVWALGSIFFTLLTSLYVFDARSISELV